MSDKLVGKGNSGDFVLSSQGTAADKGFSNVSKHWYPKTMSYEQLVEKLELEKREQKDYLVNRAGFDVVNADNRIHIKVNDELFLPTEHALRQLCTVADITQTIVCELMKDKLRSNSGKVKYTRDNEDRETLVRVYRNGLRRIDKDKKFRFRTYTDGTLRAVLSEQYRPIQNSWYLEQLQTLIPDGRVSHWRGNTDEFYGNILMPDSVREEKDSGYGGMISGGNSEIGTRVFEQSPSLFRAICMNGCIWDRNQGYSIRYVHKKSHVNLGDLAEEIKDNIHKQIPLIPTIIANFIKKKDMKLEKTEAMRNLVAQLGINFKLKEGPEGKGDGWLIMNEYLTHEAENKNLFGLINAVTRAGQKKEKEDWVRFDEIGGELSQYDEKQWDRLRGQTRHIDEERVKKFYGVLQDV